MNEKRNGFRKWADGVNGPEAVQYNLLMMLDWLGRQDYVLNRRELLTAVHSYKRQLASSIPAKKALRKLESRIDELYQTVNAQRKINGK